MVFIYIKKRENSCLHTIEWISPNANSQSFVRWNEYLKHGFSLFVVRLEKHRKRVCNSDKIINILVPGKCVCNSKRIIKIHSDGRYFEHFHYLAYIVVVMIKELKFFWNTTSRVSGMFVLLMMFQITGPLELNLHVPKFLFTSGIYWHMIECFNIGSMWISKLIKHAVKQRQKL